MLRFIRFVVAVVVVAVCLACVDFAVFFKIALSDGLFMTCGYVYCGVVVVCLFNIVRKCCICL